MTTITFENGTRQTINKTFSEMISYCLSKSFTEIKSSTRSQSLNDVDVFFNGEYSATIHS